MSLMDAIKAQLLAKAAEVAGPQNAALASSLADLVHNPNGGGLSGLLKTFEDKGLGNVAASWVASGKNLPVTPEQVENVLGPAVIAELAQKIGLTPDQFKAALVQFLPLLVDKLTPGGRLPPPPQAQ